MHDEPVANPVGTRLVDRRIHPLDRNGTSRSASTSPTHSARFRIAGASTDGPAFRFSHRSFLRLHHTVQIANR